MKGHGVGIFLFAVSNMAVGPI